MQWFLITEVYPKDMELALMFDDVEGFFIGYYFEAKNRFIRETDGRVLSNVQSWTPLPIPPSKPLEDVDKLKTAMRKVVAEQKNSFGREE